MSRAFVKEDGGDNANDDLPDKPISEHTNYVTPRGLRLLEQQFRELLQQKDGLKDQEDISSRQTLSQINRDLRYVEARLESAVPVTSTENNQKVHFGCTVDVIDEEDKAYQFTIVGEDEADVTHNLISWVSPLATALLNAECGDQVTWERPAGNLMLEISSISNHQK